MTELFRTAPREVVDYFDRRPSVPTFDWRDIAPREHALGFTVAKTAGYDVIDDLRAAVRQAVVDRKSFETFRAELTPVLQAKGWWGRKIATDPVTGRDGIVQLGSPRRLRTIYWANVASAEAAGEWARTQQTKDVLPFLEYLVSLAEHKRPEHLGWVGTTLSVDDPWWATHYPPNGWLCRCRVRQISRPAAERAPADRRDAPPVEMRAWRNRRTGETEMVPVGIDPGWQHNPGVMRDRTLSRNLAGALDRMPEEARRRAVQDLARHPLTEYVISGRASRDNHAPIAVLPQALQQAIGAKTSIVRASGEIGAKSMRRGKSGRPHHPEATFETYRLVQQAIDAGRIIQEGDRKLLVDRAVEDGLWWRASLTATKDGTEVFLSTWYKIHGTRYEQAPLRPWVDGTRPVTVLYGEEEAR
jgi:hypothetical protein